ncbi:hypothetical protein [Mesomycoplasma ovipneumoniae]|uniref:hypothetical protein n=1 Tax=Mesomycoplasma ovipneumoniae TaxID=29562 RepID=UPI00311B2CFC
MDASNVTLKSYSFSRLFSPSVRSFPSGPTGLNLTLISLLFSDHIETGSKFSVKFSGVYSCPELVVLAARAAWVRIILSGKSSVKGVLNVFSVGLASVWPVPLGGLCSNLSL